MVAVQVVRTAPIGPNVVQVKRVGSSVQVIRPAAPAPKVLVKNVGQPGPPGPKGDPGAPGAVQKVSGVAPDGSGNVDLSAVYLPQGKAGVIPAVKADNGATDNGAILQAAHDAASDGDIILIPTPPTGQHYGVSTPINWTKPNVHLQALSPARAVTLTDSGGRGGATLKATVNLGGPLLHRQPSAWSSHVRGITFIADNLATYAVLDEASDSIWDSCVWIGGTTLAYEGFPSRDPNNTTGSRNDFWECTALPGAVAGAVGGFSIGRADCRVFGGRYYGPKVYAGSGSNSVGVHFDVGGQPNVDVSGARNTFVGCNFDHLDGVAIIRATQVVSIVGGRIWMNANDTVTGPVLLSAGQFGSFRIQGARVDLASAAAKPTYFVQYGVSGSPTAVQKAAASGSAIVGMDVTGATAPWDLRPGHVSAVTSAEQPTCVPNSHAGTGATATVVGNDSAGTISVTTGTSPLAAGVFAQLNFTANRPAAASAITVIPADNPTAALGVVGPPISSTRTSAFTISLNSAPAASTTYTFYYHVID